MSANGPVECSAHDGPSDGARIQSQMGKLGFYQRKRLLVVSHSVSRSNPRPLATVLCPALCQLRGGGQDDGDKSLGISTHVHITHHTTQAGTPSSPTAPLVSVLYSWGSVLSPT